MDQDRFEPAPADRVAQYRAEIDRILDALGHSEALVTDESMVSDFPIRHEDDGPSLTELRIDLGVRVRRHDRLVDIAQRMRAHAEALIRRARPAARHTWVEWLGDRDAAALLLSLMQAIDAGSPMESLKAMVDGWRRNALRALAAEDYRADVDKYLEVSVDARLYLLARPELMRHLEDLEDAEGNDADGVRG
jgi:hypothetical protein